MWASSEDGDSVSGYSMPDLVSSSEDESIGDRGALASGLDSDPAQFSSDSEAVLDPWAAPHMVHERLPGMLRP